MTGASIRWSQFVVGPVVIAAVAIPSVIRADSLSAGSQHTWGARIAFVRFTPQSGHPQIYTLRPRGQSTPEQLHVPVTAAASPAWSPDGSSLAFIGGRNDPGSGDLTRDNAVYLSNANGSHARRLVDVSGHVNGLAWLADSKQLIVVRSSGSGTQSSVWIVSLDGRKARRLTSGYIDVEPSSAPDGRTVAFLRINPKTYRSSISLVRLDGSGVHTILAQLGRTTEPVWSPSGSALLVEDGKTLYTVRSNGSNRRVLARLSPDSRGAREDPQAAWSPDGRLVIFCQLRPGTFGASDLWEVGVDGRGLHRLTRSPGLDTAPTWGP